MVFRNLDTVGLYLVPAAAIVISLVWLSQIPGPVELAGSAVALAGVMLASSRSRSTWPEGDQRWPFVRIDLQEGKPAE